MRKPFSHRHISSKIEINSDMTCMSTVSCCLCIYIFCEIFTLCLQIYTLYHLVPYCCSNTCTGDCSLWVIEKTRLYSEFYWRVNKYRKSLLSGSSQRDVSHKSIDYWWHLYRLISAASLSRHYSFYIVIIIYFGHLHLNGCFIYVNRFFSGFPKDQRLPKAYNRAWWWEFFIVKMPFLLSSLVYQSTREYYGLTV